jgi:hypothetical protein
MNTSAWHTGSVGNSFLPRSVSQTRASRPDNTLEDVTGARQACNGMLVTSAAVSL